MSAASEKPAGATAVRPFRVEIPQAEVDELRRRIAATRWPEQETVDDGSQGTVPAHVAGALVAGGHFAAWQEPQLFSEEVRAAFRSLR
jgi:Epoxide hydrolase N terminus